MPRAVASSSPFAAISFAADFAVRNARSSRIRLDSSVVFPVMKVAKPPGWVTPNSMRVRGPSSKYSSGDRPPTDASSVRQFCQVGSATFTAE